MFFRTAYVLVKESGQKFVKDKAPRLGAALAFYTALSLAPMLLVVIALASAVFGEQAASGQVANHLEETMGSEGAEAAQAMLAANKQRPANTVSAIIGIVTLIVAATTLFAQLQDALNTVWKVEEKEGGKNGILWSVWEMVRDRLLSLSVVAGMAFLLLVSTIFGAIVTNMAQEINQYIPGGDLWIQLANITLSTVLTAAMFALIFKILPQARVAWSDAWIGAAVTAVLFNVGKFAITTYLGKMSVGSSYGAAGSVMVLLIWVYYSTQILLFGAAFTHVYATRFGAGVRTEQGVKVPDGVSDGKPIAAESE